MDMQVQNPSVVAVLIILLAIVSILIFIKVGLRNTSARWIPSLKDKHVVITGGSKGIGLALAMEALREGAFVSLISRSPDGLREALRNISKKAIYGTEQIFVKAADVGDREAISVAIEACSRWRPIDVLICNAGIALGGYLDEMPTEDADLLIRTNLAGTVYTIHAALPLMKRRSHKECPASVVLIGSLGSLHPVYGHSIYTATKHAIKGMAECLRLELLPHNIRVTLSCPGFVRTQLLEDVRAKVDEDILDIVKVVDLYDPNRLSEPADVARATMEAVKEGSFLVTNNYEGLLASTFSRGLFPAESFGRTIAEMIVFSFHRLPTYLFMTVVQRTIRKRCRVT